MSSELSAHPVLLTKLTPPPTRDRLVVRSRLLALLREGATRLLTLVAAGAGWGKTTLVGQWLRAEELRFAWVTLEASEDTPLRFWTYVLTAIDRALPGVVQPMLQQLASPQPPAIETVVYQVLNALADGDDLTIILDDYHLIETPTIHQLVSSLIDHLPTHVHMVILTRVDPPLPLARLRARDQLVEVRAADLRFDADEAARFLADTMRLETTWEQRATLEAKTEGWVAGLQLIALALRGRSDVDDVLRAIGGSQRYILDYMIEEVLSRQSQHVQRFLLQTAILDRLCGPLCDAVMGIASSEQNNVQPYSQLLLETIERQNLFLMPLDDERRWYQFHHLFATALRALLQQRTPEQISELHHRASAWYLAHAGHNDTLIGSAFAHARASKQEQQIVAVVEQLGPVLLERYASGTLRNWLESVPEELFYSRRWLAQLRAWLCILEGDTVAAERWVEQAKANASNDVNDIAQAAWQGEQAMLHGMIAWRRGDLAPSAEHYRFALDHLPNLSVLRSVATVNYGTLIAMLGNSSEAASAFAEGVRISTTLDQPIAVLTLCQQAQMEVIRGQLDRAEQLFQQAQERAARDPLRHAPYMPLVSVGIGEIRYERNDLDGAAAAFTQASERAPKVSASDAFLHAVTGLARLHVAWGDGNAARRLLHESARAVAAEGAPEWYYAAFATERARAALVAGELDAVEQWANATGLHSDDEARPLREAEHLLLARLRIAQGREAEAQDLLGRLRQSAEAGGRIGSLIAILALQSLIHANETDTIDRALQLAERAGYVRTLVDLGPVLALTLRDAGKRGALSVYAQTILGLLAAPQADTRTKRASTTRGSASIELVEPLSPRELEALHFLARGATNQEIAKRLFIAERTAKKHVTNILGKLGAVNRTQAVARAREAGLID